MCSRASRSYNGSTCAADMDGFKLLEHIGLELDLPVISERLSFLLSPAIDLLAVHAWIHTFMNTCINLAVCMARS